MASSPFDFTCLLSPATDGFRIPICVGYFPSLMKLCVMVRLRKRVSPCSRSGTATAKVRDDQNFSVRRRFNDSCFVSHPRGGGRGTRLADQSSHCDVRPLLSVLAPKHVFVLVERPKFKDDLDFGAEGSI